MQPRLRFKTSTSILMKAGAPCRDINASSVIGTRTILFQACPSQPGAPAAARRSHPEAVDTVGLSTLMRSSIVPALRPTATGSIATRVAAVEEFQRRDQRAAARPRHPRAEATKGRHPVAHVRPMSNTRSPGRMNCA
jgi:hypothetical protein